MAHGMFGATEAIFMRASWDDAYSPRDLMLTHLFTYLAIEAAYTGRTTDVEVRLKTYAPLIDRLIESGPPVPPDGQPL